MDAATLVTLLTLVAEMELIDAFMIHVMTHFKSMQWHMTDW